MKMKVNFKTLCAEYLELKELIRSQGYTVDVEEKLIKVDRKFQMLTEEICARLTWLTPDIDKTLMPMRDFRRFIEEILGDKIA